MAVRNLIVGAGISGLVLAERLANECKEEVLIIDRRDHIGGNIYDYDDNGVNVHKYGAHIFHTNISKVWEYLRRFTRFYPYMHEVLALVKGALVPVPFNLNSLATLFPESMAKEWEEKLLKTYAYGSKVSIAELTTQEELKFLSDFVYENIFYHYTLKQWQCAPQDLDTSVLSRVPVRIGKDNRYFEDRFQGIPLEGYTKMCEKMIENPLITLALQTDFKEMPSGEFERVFYSGGIDEFFDYCFGELPYRSLAFDFLKVPKEYFQKASVINYPNNYDFTRIVEYKYFLDQKCPPNAPHSVVSFEYPQAYTLGLERFYPVPNPASKNLYEKYAHKASELKNVYFIGRLGQYQYYDMDKAILKALELFETLEKTR
ncbi:UDP-galactopyranose mutase [Helicobacter sp. 11S02596-1]|uniref:UDP-galactopyranose mutase n=1 Tax=Helicobacter sp. 11S02596-1 TaxID=1476194 RepID=UPI000BA70E7D|nr:UDP-galactopyranose mutase [Helicobacter sp. 11S02596-1]PAF42812.1 UDP-galactopyranose mutase [Helicobacter sp. 11S02596-1]